jgi:hypothetical protein
MNRRSKRRSADQPQPLEMNNSGRFYNTRFAHETKNMRPCDTATLTTCFDCRKEFGGPQKNADMINL